MIEVTKKEFEEFERNNEGMEKVTDWHVLGKDWRMEHSSCTYGKEGKAMCETVVKEDESGNFEHMYYIMDEGEE